MAFRTVLMAAFWGLLSVTVQAQETPATLLAKIGNFYASGQLRSEALQKSFLQTAFWQAQAGECEFLSPNRAYVEEMLVDVETIGAPGGPKHQRRVALVVGNSGYKNFSTLKNPSNDANSMARLLRALGFHVYRGLDLTAGELEACLQSFNRELERESADIALFFYAGHGVQLTGAEDNERRNFMLATDADILSSGEGRGFKQIDAVLNEMRAHSRQSVFFYDACRNDPLGDEKPATADGVSIKRLALSRPGAAAIKVEESAATDKAGIYIAYASAPNRPADDAYEEGANHSPFTQALLNHIATPGYSLKQAMSYVSNDVGELTDWNQTPWQNSSLTEEVRLNGGLTTSSADDKIARLVRLSDRFLTDERRIDALATAYSAVEAMNNIPDIDLSKDAVEALYAAHYTHRILKGHPAEITAGAVADNGKTIITGDETGNIFVWLNSSDDPTYRIHAHDTKVHKIAINRSATIIATAAFDKTLKLWDASSGSLIHSIPLMSRGPQSLQFDESNIDRLFVVEYGHSIKELYDQPRCGAFAYYLSISTLERTYIYNNSDDCIMDVNSAQQSETIAFLLNGRVEIRNKKTMNLQRILENPPLRAQIVSISADGQNAAVASSRGEVVIWSDKNSKPTLTINAFDSLISSIMFSYDKKYLAVGGFFDSAKVFSVDSGKLITSFKPESQSLQLAFLGDTYELLSLTPRNAWLWDAETGATYSDAEMFLSSKFILHQPSKQFISLGQNKAKVWEYERQRVLNRTKAYDEAIQKSIYDPSTNLLLTLSYGENHHSVKAWDISQGFSLISSSSVRPHAKPNIAIAPNQDIFAVSTRNLNFSASEASKTGDAAAHLDIYRISSGAKFFSKATLSVYDDFEDILLHPNTPICVAYGAMDGKDTIIALYGDRFSNEVDLLEKNGIFAQPQAALFDRSKELLYVGGFSGEILVFDTATWDLVSRHELSSESVSAMTTLPNDDAIVVAFDDSKVKIWNPDDGVLAETELTSPIDQFFAATNNRFLGYKSEDNYVGTLEISDLRHAVLDPEPYGPEYLSFASNDAFVLSSSNKSSGFGPEPTAWHLSTKAKARVYSLRDTGSAIDTILTSSHFIQNSNEVISVTFRGDIVRHTALTELSALRGENISSSDKMREYRIRYWEVDPALLQ